MKLSQDNFDRAQSFIKAKARVLEQHLFEYHFENGSVDAVLTALADYQNLDGGFGHGLESDFRMADSSPIATTVAFQIFRQLEVPSDHQLVQQAVEYLLTAFDRKKEHWPRYLQQMNDAPHAPWWHFEAQEAPGFQANPSAEIVGHLWAYHPCVPAERLERWTRLAVVHLQTLPDVMEFHDMLCYLRLAEAKGLPDEFRENLKSKLIRSVPLVVARDPAQWSTYSAKPLWLAPYPSSLLSEVLASDVQLNLDYEIENQGADGAWNPFWNWGDDASSDWKQAEREWKGVLAVKTLLSLRAYGRLHVE